MYDVTSLLNAIKRLFLPVLLALFMNSMYSIIHAALPQMSPEEQAAFEEFIQNLDTPEGQKFLKDFEDEYNKLSPAEKEALNKQAEEDLKRMGIDPFAYQQPAQPITPATPSTTAPTPQTPAEPAPDCSLESAHSCQQVTSLLYNAILHIEIVRQKLNLLNFDTTTIQEWLNAIIYYLKMIDTPEHVKRLTSASFTHLFDLIAELEILLKTEAGLITTIEDTEESRSDDPYAILGIPYDATDEEITKTYTQQFAENDPEALKKELIQSHTSPAKIDKRMRRAALRQATLTDAYQQLHDPKLRQQLDRSRSHTQEQQISLRDANIQSTERLYDGINKLIQQGLIKELEDFFTRYAPTELSYHQQMEEAEKNRFAEQRAAAGITPVPSALGGFRFGGYQPESYYPGNNYFPQSYQPNFFPQSGNTESRSGGGSSEAQPESNQAKGEKSDKGDKKKDDKKKDEGKKDDKKKSDTKKEKKKDDIEQITKEFSKRLDGLKGPMTKFKDYMEADEQEGLRTHLKSLTGPRTRATKSITDGSFESLHEVLKNHINPAFIKKFEDVAKFIGEQVISNKKAIDACRPIWQAHYKAHDKTYATFELICKNTSEAVQNNQSLSEIIPWNNILKICALIEGMKTLFKEATPKDDASEKEKKDKANIKKASNKEREEKLKEQESKEKSLPTPEEIKEAEQQLTLLYQAMEKTLKDTQATNNETITKLTSALTTKKFDDILTIKNSIWDPYLNSVTFDEFTKNKMRIINDLSGDNDQQKANITRMMKDSLKINENFPLVDHIEQINKKLHAFLYPGPYPVKQPTKQPNT